MKKTVINLSIVFQLCFTSCGLCQQVVYEDPGRQRVIVLTDITNEPDDQQSLVRFLVYANEFDVEGLIATTSVHLKNKVRPDKIEELVNAYDAVRGNLVRHARGYPESSSLKSMITSHQPLYGMQGVGEGKDSDGSKLIISAVDRPDARPVWISIWGGANCLAQALWSVRQTRSKEAVEKFVTKLRVYTISDQDDSGRWIRNNFPGIFYIVSPSAESWLEYYRATWTGISGDRHYKNGPFYKFEMVDNPWLEKNIIRDHGSLGKLYPRLEYIMEGDTPAFLSLINNGLGSALTPGNGGWGGRYDLFKSYAEVAPIWTNTIHSVDEVTLDDGRVYASDQASIWRWREAYQNDFAARMDWCIAAKVSDANHNPLIVINENASKAVINIKAREGETITLSAKGSSDPDQDLLKFKWFLYKEAGRYTGDFKLTDVEQDSLTIRVPSLATGQQLHIICEGKDDGSPVLFSYRRIVISHP